MKTAIIVISAIVLITLIPCVYAMFVVGKWSDDE